MLNKEQQIPKTSVSYNQGYQKLYPRSWIYYPESWVCGPIEYQGPKYLFLVYGYGINTKYIFCSNSVFLPHHLFIKSTMDSINNKIHILFIFGKNYKPCIDMKSAISLVALMPSNIMPEPTFFSHFERTEILIYRLSVCRNAFSLPCVITNNYLFISKIFQKWFFILYS